MNLLMQQFMNTALIFFATLHFLFGLFVWFILRGIASKAHVKLYKL